MEAGEEEEEWEMRIGGGEEEGAESRGGRRGNGSRRGGRREERKQEGVGMKHKGSEGPTSTGTDKMRTAAWRSPALKPGFAREAMTSSQP